MSRLVTHHLVKTVLVTATIALVPTTLLPVAAYAATAPDAPASVGAVLDGTDAVVSWQPPASDGGSPVTSYKVSSNYLDHVTVDGSTLQVRIHVQGGRSYVFTVVATNDAGDSPGASSGSLYVPPRAPDQPVITSADPNDQQVTLHWTTQNNGAPTNYTQVRAHPHGTADSSQDIVTDSSIVTGLTNGVTYDFTVVIGNDYGNSAPSAPYQATPNVAPLKNPSAASVPADGTFIPKISMRWTQSGYGEAAIEVTPGTSTPTDRGASGVETRDPFYTSNALAPGVTYTITGWAMGYAGGRSTPTSFTFLGSVLQAKVTPNPVTFGHTAVVSATFTAGGQPVSDQHVTLWSRMYASSPWSEVSKDVPTDANGVAALPVQQQLAYAQYQFRYAGTADHLASVSNIVKVEIAPAITARLQKARIKLGKADKLWGTFRPDFSYSTMRLQELVNGTWRTRATAATVKSQRLPDGTTQIGYVLKFKPSTRGKHHYRAVWLGDSDHHRVYTSPVAVAVHR